MLPKDFFELVRQMREAQQAHMMTDNWRLILRMRILEKKVDEEIEKTLTQKNFKQSAIDFKDTEEP